MASCNQLIHCYWSSFFEKKIRRDLLGGITNLIGWKFLLRCLSFSLRLVSSMLCLDCFPADYLPALMLAFERAAELLLFSEISSIVTSLR